jgi:predicted permease
MLNGLRQDLGYALRQIRRAPGFAAVIVVTLGAATGINTSFFSMWNAGTLKPWSVKEAGRVVVVRARVSLAEWRHWTAHARSIQVTARLLGGSARSDGRRLHFDIVSANHMDVLEPVVRGRGLSSEDDRPGGPGTRVVISHRLWETHFSSDEAILGRAIRLDGVPFTIVGVAGPHFRGAGQAQRDLWLPLAAFARLQAKDAAADWDERERDVSVAGRLAPDATADQARAELATLSQQFRAQHGLAATPIVITDTRAVSGQDISERAVSSLWFVAMTFATLVACANVANLLLARGNARRGEIALRLALGAGRTRVVRQLLTEAFVLAALGSALGLAIATVVPDLIAASVPEFARRMASDFRLDHRVFLYALGLSTIACVAFGLVPALQSTRLSVAHALKDAHGLSVPSLRTSLPGYQVIVSVMLLSAAGLLVRSIQHLATKDLGYSVDDVLFVGLEPPNTHSRVQRASTATQLADSLAERVGAANVATASLGPNPGRPAGTEVYFDIIDRGTRRAGKATTIHVSATYLDVLRIPLVAGRRFTATDVPGTAAIVNEAFVRELSPHASPIGQTIAYGGAAREIVGVANDAHLGALDAVEPVILQPAAPHAVRVLMVRGADAGLAAAVRPLMTHIDPDTYVEVERGPTWIARVTSLSLFGARLIGGIGVLTLALATLGLFSVSAYTVQQRTREIGIRRALGAQPGHIARAVLAPASSAMARGLVVGGAGAGGLAFLMDRWQWLSGLSPYDPLTYVGVVVLLALSGLVASYVPARRAMAVEPTVALRYE